MCVFDLIDLRLFDVKPCIGTELKPFASSRGRTFLYVNFLVGASFAIGLLTSIWLIQSLSHLVSIIMLM